MDTPMNDRIVIVALVILALIGLLALYVGNNLPPRTTPETNPPAAQPTPTTPAP
jgi:hypothetical protein